MNGFIARHWFILLIILGWVVIGTAWYLFPDARPMYGWPM